MKMHPTTIHIYTTGPYIAPGIAPKMGPSPAMLRNWIMKTHHPFMGTWSMLSFFVNAGVSLDGSIPKKRSATLP